MAITRATKTTKTPQEIQNLGFDTQYNVPAVEQLGHDGQNMQRMNADNMAMKVTVDGSVTYIAIAAPGTAQATANWQVKKIDETTGIVITWADGDANFDNIATDLTALSYS